MEGVELVEKLGGGLNRLKYSIITSFEDLQNYVKNSELKKSNPEITVGVIFSDNRHQDGQFEEVVLKDNFENDKAAYRSFKCGVNGKLEAEIERVEEAWDNGIVDPGCNYAPIAVYIGIKNGDEKAAKNFDTAWVGTSIDRFKDEASEVFSEFAILQEASPDFLSKNEDLTITRKTSQAVKAYIGSYRKITNEEELVLNDYDILFRLYSGKENGSALDAMTKMAQGEN